MDSITQVNQLLFPVPTPSYTVSDLTNKLFWISRDRSLWRSETKPDENDSIPVAYYHCDSSNVYMIYSHGNGEDLGLQDDSMKRFRSTMKVNVLAWEYKGYGLSSGIPSVDAIKSDATSVLDFCTYFLKIPRQNIVLFGRSIGSGPTLHMAGNTAQENNHVAAVILQSAFTRIGSIASNLVGGGWTGAFVEFICPAFFNNISNIKQVKSPTFFIHGVKDTLIPCEHSKQLYQQCSAIPSEKLLELCPEATHNLWHEHNDVIVPSAEFISKFVHPVSIDKDHVINMINFLIVNKSL